MKSLVTLLVSAFTVATASSMPESTDSLSVTHLDEIVVEAPKVVHKADMDVYYPRKSAVANSKNGMQLIDNLMIPSLSVSNALGTVTSSGLPVQIRINGREASPERLRALLPQSIRRVEWIENPGLRYGDAATVLNLIVTNPDAGGSLMAMSMPSVSYAWAYNSANVKLNSGRSQFELGTVYKLTNKVRTHREYYETFTDPDGHVLTRLETPLGGRIDNTFGDLSAIYSYIRPDTTVIVVEAGTHHVFRDRLTSFGSMSDTDSDDTILLTDSKGNSGSTPLMSAYLEQHFPREQTVAVNAKTSFLLGQTYSDYLERLPLADGPLTDIHTDIKDRNKTYSVTADYIKRWENSRLTAGLAYKASLNRSTYMHAAGDIYHQRQDNLRFYAEYLQRIGKVTLTAGMGIQYTGFRFRETGLGSSSWDLRPSASVNWSLNRTNSIRLNFSSWQSAPSLTQTNPAPQQIDGFQWRIGNPDIHTSGSYRLQLSYKFSVPCFYGQIGIRANTSPDAITPFLYWTDGRLITSYENSRGLQSLSFFISPQLTIIPGWVTVSGMLRWRTERMRGTGYSLTNSAWSGEGSLQITHAGWIAKANFTRSQRNLFGEKITWDEDINTVEALYNWRSWQFGAGVIMPFGKYDRGERSLSRWNTNDRHWRINMRIPYISISCNMQWGRQKRSVSKLTDADASVDRSTAGGR